MTELCKLAAKYGTDKIHYTPFYSLLLEGRREYFTRKVLEIGIGTPAAMVHVPGYKPGASLRMWRDYFPDATIYGIDKDPSVLFSEKRIQTACADQTQPQTFFHLVKNVAPFDLIVDDGSHRAVDQMTAVNALLPHCKGLYVVEDVDPELLPMLDAQGYKYSYVQVKETLTGHCVVIRA